MSYTHLSSATPKARKEHRCSLCGESIAVGETYVLESGLWEGDFQAVKMHRECREKDLEDHKGETSWEFDEEFKRPEKPQSTNL